MMLLAVYGVAGMILVTGGLIVALAPARALTGLALLILTVTLGALALTATTPGLYYNYDSYFGDFWTATEAINKGQSGWLSSVDYFNPIGPVYSYVYALWALIEPQPGTATIVKASALAAAIAALLALVMLWRRMSLLGLSIVLLTVVGVAVSGRGNGELLYQMPMHYLAPYNRWGWALFVPVALRLALPYRRDLPGDLALGLAIALMLMLKVTYGAAALGLVAARLVLVPGSWRELPLLAAGLAVVLAGIELATGQVSAHLRDLALTASLPQSGLRLTKLFEQLGEAAIFTLIALVAYLGTLERTALWADLRPVLLIGLVAGAGCAVLMQNHYRVEAAVYPLLPLIALEWTGVLRSGLADLRQRVLMAGAAAAMLFFPVIDVAMHVGQRVQYVLNGPDPAFAGTAYADLRFEPYMVESQNSLLNRIPDGRAGVLEGLALLRAAGADAPGAGAVATLDFSNPFPMLLGQPSPAGTPIWMHADRSFSRAVFVAPEVLFAGVDYVMSPSTPGLLEEIYAETLDTAFEVTARGSYWILRVRRGEDGA